MPERFRRFRMPGYRVAPGVVYVGPPSKWRNPWLIRPDGRNGWAVTLNDRPWLAGFPDRVGAALKAKDLYRSWITDSSGGRWPGLAAYASNHGAARRDLSWLAGRDVACWCPLIDADGNRFPCHGDLLIELSNGEGEFR